MGMLIDPAGGVAGDIFVAALISAGADSEYMKTVMLSAADKLGDAEINIKKTRDGSLQLDMKLDPKGSHLSGDEAELHLRDLFREYNIGERYRILGKKILAILLEAEKKAHAEYHIHIAHSGAHHHHEGQHHGDHHHRGTFLHEAQDIIIDIMGTVAGMQILKIEPMAVLLNPVSVGGGTINFSHGIFNVPAPATKIILESHGIPWKPGPIEKELCTPTGAAIMASLGARLDRTSEESSTRFSRNGRSRGIFPYDIPAFKIFIS
jgi:uncharacterized protein (DUF111 family)